jgi:hypothetical protein
MVTDGESAAIRQRLSQLVAEMGELNARVDLSFDERIDQQHRLVLQMIALHDQLEATLRDQN